MNLKIQHVEVHVSSLSVAKEFYVSKLGLEVLEEIPPINIMALRAGNVRYLFSEVLSLTLNVTLKKQQPTLYSVQMILRQRMKH